MKINEIGINFLNSDSNVKELLIQYKLDRKYPNPKNHPIKKLVNMFLLILVKIKKSKDKVKKLI